MPARSSQPLPWTHAAAGLLVGTFAFSLRFFGFRGFANDHFMHLAWSRQLLAGELPGRDFIDPGMPLTYGLSALAQAISPGPFSEVLLTTVAMAVATALLCVIVCRLTGSVAIGVGAALFAIALEPRLYNYPKVLLPMITLAAVALYAARPSRRGVALLAAWTIIAGLFRYDFGLYTGVAMAAALVTQHYREPKQLGAAVGVYVLAALALCIPYLAFLQWTTGIERHLAEAVEFARSDEHQLIRVWSEQPQLSLTNPVTWGRDDFGNLLFYVSYGVVAASLVLLAVRGGRQPKGRAPVLAAATALLICYVAFVLRYALFARVPDLASVLAVMAAWTLFESGRIATAGLSKLLRSPAAARIAAAFIVAVLAAPMLVGLWGLSNIREGVNAAALTNGWRGMSARAAVVRQSGTQWPWEREWPSGDMPEVVRYLDQCTGPSDRLLVTWPAPEYYYFSRRLFGAGHALLLPPRAFTGSRHQERMIARLESEFVPIVLINESRWDEFHQSYGLLAEYLTTHYEASGRYTAYDDSVIVISRRRDLRATSTYGSENWPCHLRADETTHQSSRIGEE